MFKAIIALVNVILSSPITSTIIGAIIAYLGIISAELIRIRRERRNQLHLIYQNIYSIAPQLYNAFTQKINKHSYFLYHLRIFNLTKDPIHKEQMDLRQRQTDEWDEKAENLRASLISQINALYCHIGRRKEISGIESKLQLWKPATSKFFDHLSNPAELKKHLESEINKNTTDLTLNFGIMLNQLTKIIDSIITG